MEKINLDLNILYEERNKYIDEGSYIKANEISNQIKLYKKSIFKNQKNTFRLKKAMDEKMYEDNYNRDMQNYLTKWDKNESDFLAIYNDKEIEIKNMHKNEINLFLVNGNNIKIQITSPDYLNLKKIEKTLVDMERYLEADEIKKRADKLLKKETYIKEIEMKFKLETQYNNILNKQKEELKKFNDEKNKQLYLLNKEKMKEFNEIQNRYRIIKNEINNNNKKQELKANHQLTNKLHKRHFSQESRGYINKSNIF